MRRTKINCCCVFAVQKRVKKKNLVNIGKFFFLSVHFGLHQENKKQRFSSGGEFRKKSRRSRTQGWCYLQESQAWTTNHQMEGVHVSTHNPIILMPWKISRCKTAVWCQLADSMTMYVKSDDLCTHAHSRGSYFGVFNCCHGPVEVFNSQRLFFLFLVFFAFCTGTGTHCIL